jgi:hypothetical protein
LSCTPATVSGYPAEHHVVDPVRVQSRVADLDLVEQPYGQVDRLDLVQRAVLLALAAGRADGVVHEGLWLLSHVAGPNSEVTGCLPIVTLVLLASTGAFM